jgi:glycosyltransferase involved in cell wall biosynthesis
LFEALATGVPVVSTPVGWAPYFAGRAPQFVRIGNSPASLAEALEQIAGERAICFARRMEIAALAAEPRLDSWFSEVLALAASLTRTRSQARACAAGGGCKNDERV